MTARNEVAHPSRPFKLLPNIKWDDPRVVTWSVVGDVVNIVWPEMEDEWKYLVEEDSIIEQRHSGKDVRSP